MSEVTDKVRWRAVEVLDKNDNFINPATEDTLSALNSKLSNVNSKLENADETTAQSITLNNDFRSILEVYASASTATNFYLDVSLDGSTWYNWASWSSVTEVKEGYYKACILERIAESYVSAGRISEAVALVRRAKATAEEIGEPRRSLVVGGCSRLLAKMAAMGERELWSEALKCLEGHAAISNRIYCEIQVAKEMFNAGMADMAEKVAGRVEREVDALDKPIPKYLLGRELALTLLEAGFKHGKRSLAARATALVRSASGVGKQAEFLQEIIERSIGIVKGGSGCSV
nr:hypothetical protein [Candidatus Freyrarchaeum guaymaensis]